MSISVSIASEFRNWNLDVYSTELVDVWLGNMPWRVNYTII